MKTSLTAILKLTLAGLALVNVSACAVPHTSSAADYTYVPATPVGGSVEAAPGIQDF